MPIYQAKLSDVMLILDRVYSDADHGRTSLALARVQELGRAFPDHAKIAYAEGVIRRDYIGQGLAARDCFERAVRLDSQHAFAVENATFLARNAAEFRQWATRFRQVVPKRDPSHRNLDQILELLDQGHNYVDVYASFVNSRQEAGTKAAHYEVLFSLADLPPEQEAHNRRMRAQMLRELDTNAAQLREGTPEQFPPSERIELAEALRELERALSADPFEAEVWNLRASWLVVLGRYTEAIEVADQAIKLRPHGYPKPHHNKATALMRLGKKDEALLIMKTAEEASRAGNFPSNLAAAQDLIERWKAPPPSETALEQHTLELARALAITCRMRKETEVRQVGAMGWTTIPLITTGFLANRDLPSIFSVHFLAETLGVFSPETVFVTLNSLGHRSRDVYAKSVEAAVYIASHSDGVEQVDATRLISLTILTCGSLSLSKLLYRQLVFAPSSTGQLGEIAARVSNDLQAIDPVIATEILKQPPISQADAERAKGTILARLAGDPRQPQDSAQYMSNAPPSIIGDPDNALNSIPLLFPAGSRVPVWSWLIGIALAAGAIFLLWKWLT